MRGTLRLNVAGLFRRPGIGTPATCFLDSYPAITIELGLNDRQVDLIEEGWDLVVRIGSMADSTMIARRIAPCRTIVCAAPTYLKRRGKPKTIADLTRHDCLGYTLSKTVGADRWSFGPKGKASVAVKGALRANNGDALVAAAIAGQGIVYQPEFLVAREIREGLLVPLKLDHNPVELDGSICGLPFGAPSARESPGRGRLLGARVRAGRQEVPMNRDFESKAGRSAPWQNNS